MNRDDLAAARTVTRGQLAEALLRAVPGYQRWMEWPAATTSIARQQAGAAEAEAYNHACAIWAALPPTGSPETLREALGELAGIVEQTADGLDKRWERDKAEGDRLIRHPAEQLLVNHLRAKAAKARAALEGSPE